MMAILALMRHGESESGQSKCFAGWDDVALSAAGRDQAAAAARSLADSGIEFTVFHTSLLRRAGDTMAIVRAHCAPPHIPTQTTWLLNERHYGALQGQLRSDAVREYGAEAVIAWRRDYRARPPLLDDDDQRHPIHDQRYQAVAAALLPAAESLESAALRVVPWWQHEIETQLRASRNVLVVAHTASLRGLTRLIEALDDESTAAFRIATCSPVLYEFDKALVVQRKFSLNVNANSRWRRLRSRFKPTRLLPWM